MFVDIPFDGGDSSSCRGKSPSTPKRSRKDLGETDDFFYDEVDISPIGFPPVDDLKSPRTTPKRRKSLDRRVSSSLTDLFSSIQKDGRRVHQQCPISRSVDFSAGVGFSTPPRREMSVTPNAPRKSRSHGIGLDELSSVSRELFATTPPSSRPIRTTRLLSTSPTKPVTRRVLADDNVDYSSVMSIVGFVSSFIARCDEGNTTISSLVDLITSVSINHRTAVSATRAIFSLVKVVPEWVQVHSDRMRLVFNKELKTFDVLTKLRTLKRAQQQNQNLQAQQRLRHSLTSSRDNL